MIQWMLAIWFLVPLPFLNPAWTSGSSGFMYSWSLARRILSITLLASDISTIVQYSEHYFDSHWEIFNKSHSKVEKKVFQVKVWCNFITFFKAVHKNPGNRDERHYISTHCAMVGIPQCSWFPKTLALLRKNWKIYSSSLLYFLTSYS